MVPNNPGQKEKDTMSDKKNVPTMNDEQRHQVVNTFKAFHTLLTSLGYLKGETEENNIPAFEKCGEKDYSAIMFRVWRSFEATEDAARSAFFAKAREGVKARCDAKKAEGLEAIKAFKALPEAVRTMMNAKVPEEVYIPLDTLKDLLPQGAKVEDTMRFLKGMGYQLAKIRGKEAFQVYIPLNDDK